MIVISKLLCCNSDAANFLPLICSFDWQPIKEAASFALHKHTCTYVSNVTLKHIMYA